MGKTIKLLLPQAGRSVLSARAQHLADRSQYRLTPVPAAKFVKRRKPGNKVLDKFFLDIRRRFFDT
jgi:hypothetical protein